MMFMVKARWACKIVAEKQSNMAIKNQGHGIKTIVVRIYHNYESFILPSINYLGRRKMRLKQSQTLLNIEIDRKWLIDITHWSRILFLWKDFLPKRPTSDDVELILSIEDQVKWTKFRKRNEIFLEYSFSYIWYIVSNLNRRKYKLG